MNYVRFIVLCLITTIDIWGKSYLDLSLGPNLKKGDGANEKYHSELGASGELSLGRSFEHWDYSLDVLYSYNKLNDFKMNFGSSSVKENFHWQTLQLGPTVKHKFYNNERTSFLAPFIGGFLEYGDLSTSKEIQAANSQQSEDLDYHYFSYGVKTGIQFKTLSEESSWLDAVSYKFYVSYSKPRYLEGYVQDNQTISEYKGDMSDKFVNYSVGFLVGYSFGEKTINKVKQLWK